MSDGLKAIRANLGMPANIRTIGLAAGLFVLGIVSRLPFQSQILHHWDSVNFALALEHFDVRLHQPHPPGMFVFYIMLGRFLNLFLHDANSSLVWISIIASGMSAATIFVLGSKMFSKRVGLISALLTLSSPLVWFHGEVALSYMLEYFWVMLIVGACFTARSGDKRVFFASALLIGLAGGIRPNTAIFIFPLWLAIVAWGLRERKYSIRDIIAALAAMGLGGLAWAIPLVVMSGGPSAYWDTMQWWLTQHVTESGSAEGLTIYMARLTVFTVYGLGVGLVPIGWALLRGWRTLKDRLLYDWPLQTMVLWLALAAPYFAFIHLKQPGHIFTIMPALILVAANATNLTGRYLERFGQNTWIAVTALVVICNSSFFLFGPATLFGSSRSIFSTPTWSAIREYDVYVISRLQAIRQSFSPADTAVVADSRNFRLPDFYLRDYQNTDLSYQLGDVSIVLPDHVRTLVLFDTLPFTQAPADTEFHLLPLSGEGSIRYLAWSNHQRLKLNSTRLEIENR
jgi:hypothetical protein